MSASDVTFAHHEVALGEPFHVISDKIDNPHKLMADRHRYGNRFLRPSVPVIYMTLGPADRRFEHTDEHVIALHLWNWNVLEPKPRLSLALDHGLHRFLHGAKYPQISQIHTDSIRKSFEINLRKSV